MHAVRHQPRKRRGHGYILGDAQFTTSSSRAIAQQRFARNVSDQTSCDVVDLDAAHMRMISQPAALAQIIDDIARRSEAMLSG